MRGAQDIVKRRLAGVPVPGVEFSICARPPHDLSEAGLRYFRKAETRWPIERHMPVWIEPSDGIGSLDIRCAVKLPVIVYADVGSEERAAHLVERLLPLASPIQLITESHIDVWNSHGYMGNVCK